MEIQFTGLRPGEKLFEELYGRGESHVPTSHPKIMAASGAPRNFLQVIYDIGRLQERLSDSNDQLRAVIREIVPPYQSNAEASKRRKAA